MKIFNYAHFPSGKWKRILFYMKIKLVVLLCTVGTLAASPSFSQQKRLDISYNNVSLTMVLDDLKSRTGIQFLYFEGVVPEAVTVSMNRRGASVEEILNEVLVKNGLSYSIRGEVIVISRADERTAQKPADVQISGTVKNNMGVPMAGVTVYLKSNPLKGTVTDAVGRYTLSVPASNSVLVFSYIGMTAVEQSVTGGKTTYDITMTPAETEIDEVVVTGIFDRPRESYTGSATMINNEQLRASSAQGLISAISNVDPAFKVVRSNAFGSDPNKINTTEITMRGSTALADYQADAETAIKANLPLFIIDRFESDLESFISLDESRVQNVVILKDASATALYGSKASNGVVVVTTKQPQQGKLRVMYSGNFAFNAPDLSSYNLMNAREKLQYELDAGLYESPYIESAHDEMRKYYAKKVDVERGVNTDWLHYPVRLGFTNKHSVTLEGGADAVRYSVSLFNNNVQGVMKGSSRNTFNGDMFLHYSFKNFTFSNRLKVSNVYAPESPYGDFEQYTKMNAYWKPHDDDGNLKQILDPFYYPVLGYGSETAAGGVQMVSKYSANPLWNASLPSKNEEKYTAITNNFLAEWFISENLIMRGDFSIYSKNLTQDVYKSPDHTDFRLYEDEDIERKGSYYYKNGKELNYSGNLSLSYSRVFNDIHSLNAGISGKIDQQKSHWYGFMAEGLTVNNVDFLPTASRYKKDGKPDGGENIKRGLSGSMFANYMYGGRYYADFSLTVDGSSQFGSDNRVAPFGSLGVGWNMHNEKFMKNQSVVNRAQFKGSYGYTGSVNFSPYDALRMYKLITDANYKGEFGMSLVGLGNPSLGWQTTHSFNVGVDLGLFRDRLTARFDLYNRVTNDLVTSIGIPSASGVSRYQSNIGKVGNRGFEASLAVRVIDDREKNLRWTIGGNAQQNRNKVLEIGHFLDAFNDEKLATDGLNKVELREFRRNPVFLYREGESMKTNFAVRSKGIDPSSGKEIFVKLDGTETFTWSSDDLTACGVDEPTLWGSLFTELRWRGFTLTMYFYYTMGAYKYNHTLANKVENIYPYMNADRRAYTDRWKKPGDVSQFKSVRDYDSETAATSRFIMKENTLQCTSITLRYVAPREWSKRHLGMERLEIQGNMEDAFYISTIRRDRGTSYPFANNFSLSLNITF